MVHWWFHSCCMVVWSAGWLQVNWLLLSSWGKHDIFWSAHGHAVSHWMVTGMAAVWKQGHWMFTAFYHVVSSDVGYMRCLITMGPILGTTLCHRFCSVSHFLCSWKTHSCTGPTGLKTLMLFDVIGYYDLYNSMAARIQYNQGDIQSVS